MKNFLIPTLLSLSLVCLTSAKSVVQTEKRSADPVYCIYDGDVAFVNFLQAHGYRASSPNIPADILRAGFQAWGDAYDRCVAESQ